MERMGGEGGRVGEEKSRIERLDMCGVPEV